MLKRVDQYLLKAEKQFEQQEFEQCLKTIEHILLLDPENVRANYLKGLILSKKKKYREAIPYFKIVSNKTDDFLIKNQVNLLLGYIYYELGNIQRALNFFLEVEKQELESSPLFNALATCYHKLGKINKAIYYGEKALKIKKDNFNAMNTLGFILVDSEKDIEKGFKLIKQALNNDPDNPARLDSMGWAYFKKKEYKLAETFLRRAYQLAPDEKEIREHIEKLNNILKNPD